MFQFNTEFEDMFCAARRVECSRELNPQLQSFAQWLAQNAKRIADPAARRSACVKTLALLRDAVGVLRVVGRRATGGSPRGHGAFSAVAAAAQRDRTLRRGLAASARGQHRVRAAVPVVVRRHEQAPLDLSAAWRCYRCIARRCVGISGRHASVEGVQLRPPRRDALHRATGRRFMALRCVRVEQGRHRCGACGGGRCGAAGQRRARRPLRCSVTQRLPGVP